MRAGGLLALATARLADYWRSVRRTRAASRPDSASRRSHTAAAGTTRSPPTGLPVRRSQITSPSQQPCSGVEGRSCRDAAPAAAVHRADPGGADGAGAGVQPVRAIGAAVPQIAVGKRVRGQTSNDHSRPSSGIEAGLRRARTNATIARRVPAARAPPSGRVATWACAGEERKRERVHRAVRLERCERWPCHGRAGRCRGEVSVGIWSASRRARRAVRG
jgi:hypothetical protein